MCKVVEVDEARGDVIPEDDKGGDRANEGDLLVPRAQDAWLGLGLGLGLELGLGLGLGLGLAQGQGQV